MLIRVGLPSTNGLFPTVAGQQGYAALISAGCMWRKSRFHPIGKVLHSVPSVALDSAGFVAMKRHGGYPWTEEQYLDVAQRFPWAWWSAMDYCCEPEIAGDKAEIRRRVGLTAQALGSLGQKAQDRGMPPPLPILQGYNPDDYMSCMELLDRVLGGKWPPLVGIGSVCRRPLRGSAGLHSVLGTVLPRLPQGVGVHLFGVKGSALIPLRGMPKVASVDSCAWDAAARYDINHQRRALGGDIRAATRQLPNTVARRAQFLVSWMESQLTSRERPSHP
jgi:hypothetical protein